jgi:hypothetical protein
VAPLSAQARGRTHYHLTVGVGDDSSAIFANPWFRKLPIRIARYLVPWNAAITRDRTQVNAMQDWLHWAASVHVQPLVSFEAPGGTAGNYIPDDATYTRAVKAFIKRFPQVKTYTPWNEPDFIYRSLSQQPGLAAAYFNTMVRACHRCTIVAGDVYRTAGDGLYSWLKAYQRGLRFRPAAWAIHPYDDVRSHTKSAIDTLERFAGSSQIWLDEISGVLRRGHWPFPNQSPNNADNDERFLFILPKIYHNITRIYHYQWQAVPGSPWDSALLGPGGKPRPAYWTFANAVKGKLPG